MSDNESTETLKIVLTSKNEPFTRDQDASTAMKRQKLSENDYLILPYETGFAIVHKDYIGELLTRRSTIIEEPSEIKYFKVQFHQKSSANDQNEVHLQWNGNCLILHRGIPVILPDYYLEIADHAVYNQYRKRGNETRKIVAQVSRFPYNVICESTKEEYEAFLTKGNQKRDDDFEKAYIRE